MNVHAFLLVAALTVAPAVAAPLDGHLYAASTAAGKSVVQRYPLYGGLPVQRPDLTIPNAAAPIAVSSDGTVAAFIGKNEVGFFAADQTQPKRTLFIRSPESGCPLVVQSIVMDAQEYLFVSYVDAGSSCYAEGVLVYDPSASGNTKPVQTFTALFGSLALDPHGQLYISPVQKPGYQTSVAVYGSPRTHPHLVQTIVGVVPFGDHIAIDAQAGRLWTYTVPAGSEYGVGRWGANSLISYSLTNSGGGLPGTGIYARVADSAPTGEVAYRGGLLYATFSGPDGGGVNVFPVRASGLTDPMATLRGPQRGFDDMTVGP
jgi:hypothetical protein